MSTNTRKTRQPQASPRFQEAHEQEQVFLERARSGEPVGNEVVLFMQPSLHALARRIHWRYVQRQGNVVEVSDLVNEASAEILSCFIQALEKDEPFPYLYRLAYFSMIDCVNARSHAIRTHPAEEKIVMLSLDRPVTDDGTCLADLLPHETAVSREFSQVSQAIEGLPAKQREVVCRYFGIAGYQPQSFRQVSQYLSPKSSKPLPNRAEHHYKRALLNLRQSLASQFPQCVAGGMQ